MFTLTGTIIDHTGAPRAYVDVNITPVPAVTPTGASLAAGGRRIRTDSLGQFSIDLVHAPGQTYQVSVPAANIFQRFPVPEADGSTIDLHEVTEIMVPTPLSPVVRGLPGKSTYDLAVETGFEGTLEEWLEAQKAVAAAHGSLTGLDDDDHPQYLTEARGDARYLTADDIPDLSEIPDLSDVIREGDVRLSDAREPTEHSHPEYLTADDIPDLPDLSGVVRDDDPRLSDAREPTAHSHPEYLTADDLPEAPDLSDVVREGDARLSDPRPPTEHRHAWSDLDDTPDIPATPEDIGAQPAGDYATRDEIPEVPPAPDLSGFVTDDDPRLSDAREPTEHDHDGRYVRTVNGNGPDETGNVTVEGGGGEGGTDDHRALSYRSAPDAHPISAITGLTDALESKQPVGDYLTSEDLPEAPNLSDVVREGDPRLSDARDPNQHRHAWADLDDPPTIPATPEDIGAQPAGDYAAADHDHDGVYVKPADLPDVSDVVREGDPRLTDDRTPTVHDHAIDDVTGLQDALDGKAATAHDHDDRYYTEDEVDSALAGKANTSHTHADYAPATHDHDGTYQPVGDYAAGTHTHTEYVETTDPRLSDARTPTAHDHTIGDVTGLQSALDGKQPSGSYAPATHDHDDRYYTESEVDTALAGKADATHQHNYSDISDPPVIPASPADIGAQPAGDYLTPGDLPDPPDLSDVVRDDDARLSDARPPTEHDHDDRYYTEDEVDTALDGKADTSHSHPVTDLTATGTPSETTYLRGDGAWATPEGQGPSHESILASGNVALPTEHPVLTIRADDPATLSLPEAPDGTVVTIHVAHGWENLTWAPGITVTGDSFTTETWVVLVRKEGAWSALVSGSGGGGVTGHGRPDGKSWPHGEPIWTQGAPIIAPLGTTYTDLDRTDGAVQWMVTNLGYITWLDPETGSYTGMADGPIWEVTIGQTEWGTGSQSWYENQLTPPAGYDEISIEATRKGDWVDVQISLLPSGIGQGVPVTVPAVEYYPFGPTAPQNFAPTQYEDIPIEIYGDPDFAAAVGEPPQATLSGIELLSIPSFEIGAFTAGEHFYASMSIEAEYRIKYPLPWPIQMEREPGGGGGVGI